MTEADMIARAKMYMEKLANGIDPLTGEYVKSGDCAAAPRMRKCFAFTAGVLEKAYTDAVRRDIKEKRRNCEDFFIDADVLESFPYSDAPIGIAEICRRFNSLIDEGKNKRLKTTSVTAFLITSGLIEKTDNTVRPTDAGRAMGIEVLHKVSAYNGQPYDQVVYPRSVQQFIVDNIDALCAYNRERAIRTAANSGK